jgi:uncharacterized protein YgbK (DUF1537 family)
MIGVLADDLTGAAEIAGHAFGHGLQAEVQSAPFGPSDSQVLVFNTDSRSCAAEEASSRVAEAVAVLRALGAGWLFKKVDSVLRGPVYAEICAFSKGSGTPRCLLLAGNPELGRTSVNGRLHIGGVPLDRTEFARDPEYPAQCSDIAGLLNCPADSIASVKWEDEQLPLKTILAGDVASEADLDSWAERAAREEILTAGSAAFFSALLRARGHAANSKGPEFDSGRFRRTLWINGSSSSVSLEALAGAEAKGMPVLRMPERVFGGVADDDAAIDEWARALTQAMENRRCVAAAVGRPLDSRVNLAADLNINIQRLAAALSRTATIDHIAVEGGATASAVIRGLRLCRLHAVQEWAPGVVSLQSQSERGLLVTLKPGSYAWPPALMRIFTEM